MPGDTIAQAYVAIRPDLSGFREELASGLDAEVESLGGKTVRIDADTLDADRKIADTGAALDDLGHRSADPRVDASTDAARAKIFELQARIDMLSTEAALVRLDVDDQGAKRKLTDLQSVLEDIRNETIAPRLDEGRMAELNTTLDDLDHRIHNIDTDLASTSASADKASASLGGGGGGLLAALLPLSPALVTVGAAGSAGLAGITLAAGAATIGLGAFALAAKDDLTTVKNQVDSVYSRWTQTTDAFVEPVIQNAVGMLPGVFALLTPSVATASQALQGLEGDIRGSLGSPYLHQFSQFVAGEGGTAITSFGHLVGGLGHLLSGFMEGFAPELQRIDADMSRWGADMTKWGDEAANGGMSHFLAYVEQNGPLVAHTFEQLGTDFVTLMKASAPLGPVWLNILDVASKLLDDLLKLNPELTTWAIGLGSVGLAANKLLSPVGGLSGVAVTAGKAWSIASDAFAVGSTGLLAVTAASSSAGSALLTFLGSSLALVPGLDIVSAAVLQATGVFSNFGDGISKADQQFAQQFVDSLPAGADKIAAVNAEINQLGQSTQVYGDTVNLIWNSITTKDWPKIMGTQIDQLPPKYAALKAGLLQVADGTEKVHTVGDNFEATAAGINDKIQALQNLLPGLTQAQDAQNAATQAANTAMGEAAGYTGSMAEEFGALQSQLQTANQALSQTETLLNTMLGAELSVEQATTGFYSAVQSLSSSLQTNGTSMDLTTQKGLANRQAFDQVAAAIQNSIQAMEKQNATAPEIAANVQQLTGYVETQAAKYGLTKAQVDNYLHSLGLTPKQVTTDLQLSGYTSASANVSNLKNQLNNLKGSYLVQIAIDAYMQTTAAAQSASKLKHFARGTSGAAGGPAVVGEEGPEAMFYRGSGRLVGVHGPEVADVPRGATILTASQTARLPRYAEGADTDLSGIISRLQVPVSVRSTPVTLTAPPIEINFNGTAPTAADAQAIAAQVAKVVDDRFAEFEAEIDLIRGAVPV